MFIILSALFKSEQSQRGSPWTSPSAHLEAAELMQEDCKSQPHILMPTADQHCLKSRGIPLRPISTTLQV